MNSSNSFDRRELGIHNSEASVGLQRSSSRKSLPFESSQVLHRARNNGGSASPSHEIVIARPGQDHWREIRQQCYDVRIEVFHREQGFPLETEIDELDEFATHILLRLLPSLEPVGTIRFSEAKDGSYYKLSRLAVLKEYRQFKFGRELVLALHDHVEDILKQSGAHDLIEVVCHAQIPVKGFYAKFGYQPEGEEFDEDGAPHVRMVARLQVARSRSTC